MKTFLITLSYAVGSAPPDNSNRSPAEMGSYIIENVVNEADAINEAFKRAGLNGGEGYVHVIAQECPIGPKRKQ